MRLGSQAVRQVERPSETMETASQELFHRKKPGGDSLERRPKAIGTPRQAPEAGLARVAHPTAADEPERLE